MDYWAGTFGLVVFALLEVLIFAWIFGMDQAWEEINRGAFIRLPKIFYYIIKYVAPLYLMALLGFWLYFDAIEIFLMKKDPYGEPVASEDIIYRLGARIMMIVMVLVIALIVRHVWKKKKDQIPDSA